VIGQLTGIGIGTGGIPEDPFPEVLDHLHHHDHLSHLASERGIIHQHQHLVDHYLLDSLHPKNDGLFIVPDREVRNDPLPPLQQHQYPNRQKDLFQLLYLSMRCEYHPLDLGVRGSHLLDLLFHLVHVLYNTTTKSNTKLSILTIIRKHQIPSLLD
jgi:hypothetical protein